ncbi:MAG: caspase family protein [Bryobacterales bacterium]|nr:caspase family protein [Bryobacterales bacterium]
MIRILLLLGLFAPFAGFAQQRPAAQRDLKVEKDAPPAAAPAAAIPRSYALVMGISSYKNLPAEHQLRYAERDAEEMYSVLISPEGGNFRAENVHTLIGPKATLANMRRELEQWLPSVAQEDDRVLVYFAGHGFVSQGRPYLAPYDIALDQIAKTAYPMATLGSVFGKLKAKWKVLLTDSCHSGAVAPDADVQAINRSLMDLSRSLFSLTASRDRERSFESPDWGGGHGIFTYYVVRGMEGEADENRDGVVTADELAEYVRRNVREATSGQQNPTSDRSSFDPDMLLAYVPSRASAGAPPPPKFGALIVETNMDGVEVFLDGKSVGVAAKGQPLRLPGLAPGSHTIQGVKMGYEPDGPREEMVYPGQEKTVTLRIMVLRRRNKAATDAFERGLELYSKGYEDNYRRAAGSFEKALKEDPRYSQAALYLGRTYNALFDETRAQQAFRKAIEIDPDYLEARASYAGMLLDIGDADEAIRQLTVVVRRDSKHAMAYYLLAQAFRMKEQYAQSVEAARTAIRLNPANPEPHFWLAESLRLGGNYDEAAAEYGEYLRLSDFDSKLAGKLNYYVLGFLAGFGKKKRAAQQDIWKDLRSLAYFGICDCRRKQSDWDAAIFNCQKALTYDPEDPYVHYALGLAYARKAQASGSVESLPAARQHFAAMLRINSDMSEAEYARKNLASIDAALKAR